MAYSDKVVDHYQNPRNVGSFGASKEVKERKDIGVGIVGAPECGDVMQLQIKVSDDGRIDHREPMSICSPVASWMPGNARCTSRHSGCLKPPALG